MAKKVKIDWKSTLSHGLVAFLYAAGLSMTLLCVMGFTSQIPLCLTVCLAVTALCTAASLTRLTALMSGGLVILLGGAWLGVMDGMTLVSDVLRAATLHMSGLTAALPLFSGETVLLLAVLCALAAFLLTWQGAGGIPALMTLLLAVLLLWLGDTPQAMVYMLPAVIATVALMVHLNHVILPLRRILPLAAGVVVMAYLIVPASGVTIGPMKEAADALRQRIFDYLFFTEARSVFTLATEGYYPQGQGQLGGPANPDDSPVMMVATPKMVYLRGAVKDEYTGRVWLDTQAGRRYLWVSPRWGSERERLYNENLPQGALGADEGLMSVESVSVRMMDQSASSMFVPQRIRELSPGGDLVPYFNASSETFATRDLQAGDTYTVSAPLMLGGEPGLGTLVTACAASGDAHYAAILQEYTKLPAHLQKELYDLATKVTAEAVTPYDKAYALQTYLSRSYRYALDAEVVPGNIDFVSYFLLQSKEGYCTYFASAMTVLCRMAGLPARYVEGYLARPGENGVAYVTGLDGHAWTEVYFEGFGWLTFDATPILSNQSDGPSDSQNPPETDDSQLPTPPPPENDPPPQEEPTPTPEMEDVPEPTPEPSNQPRTADTDKPDVPRSWWWWLLILLLIAAAAARILLTQPVRLAQREKTELGRWNVWMQALHDELRVMGLSRQPSESPLAYMRRLDGTHRLPAELTPLGECASLVFYGRMDPEPEETRMTTVAYRRILSVMPWYRQVQLCLLRAFVPLTKRSFTRQ